MARLDMNQTRSPGDVASAVRRALFMHLAATRFRRATMKCAVVPEPHTFPRAPVLALAAWRSLRARSSCAPAHADWPTPAKLAASTHCSPLAERVDASVDGVLDWRAAPT